MAIIWVGVQVHSYNCLLTPTTSILHLLPGGHLTGGCRTSFLHTCWNVAMRRDMTGENPFGRSSQLVPSYNIRHHESWIGIKAKNLCLPVCQHTVRIQRKPSPFFPCSTADIKLLCIAGLAWRMFFFALAFFAILFNFILPEHNFLLLGR